MWVSQTAITKLNQVFPPIFELGIGNAHNYRNRYVLIYDIYAFQSQQTNFSQRFCFVMVLRVQIVSDQSKYNFKTKTIMSIFKKGQRG